MKTEFDWNDGKYVPDNRCYCLCEIEGMPYTKYTVLQWDGQYWMIWIYISKEAHGWCGLREDWKVKRWCIIEEIQYEDK